MPQESRYKMSSAVYCGKCKTKVVSYVKCVSCEGCYHPSCAKNLKFEFYDKFSIKCCENVEATSPHEDESDNNFFDAIEELHPNNNVDIRIFKYIIKQKDNLIAELRSQIKILNNRLVSNQNSACPSMSTKTSTYKTSDKQMTSPSETVNNGGKSSRNYRTTKLNHSTGHMESGFPLIDTIPSADREHISEKDDGKTEKGWRKVRSKKSKSARKALVVGNYAGSSTVKGIDRKISFHVSNLKPETTVEELQSFLVTNFPEVKCESLKSRYPESYTSFRVEIYHSNYEKAMLAENWPIKACVRNFFRRRDTTPQV